MQLVELVDRALTTASSTQRSSGSGQGRCGRAAGVMDAVSEHHRAVVELDGLQWHRGLDRRQRDDVKGNAVVLGHYRLLQFSWGDVFERGDRVIAQAAALVADQPGP